MSVLILTRHGESEWNARQMLTGWSDPPLTDRGERQARRGGAGLAERGVGVDRVYTSMLRRATRTASIMLASVGAGDTPVHTDWRLNERHLGRLEGLTKAEVTATWGNEWRKKWRDDEFSRPPALHPDDPHHPRHDPRYRHVPPGRLPASERGCDAASRVLDFWHEHGIPDVVAGRNVMIVSHLGPLRILARHLGWASADAREPADWPNGEPLVRAVAACPCCPRSVRADSK